MVDLKVLVFQNLCSSTSFYIFMYLQGDNLISDKYQETTDTNLVEQNDNKEYEESITKKAPIKYLSFPLFLLWPNFNFKLFMCLYVLTK